MPYKSVKRKSNLDKTVEGMPTPLKKVCQQLGTTEEVTLTFDDLAGCDSVLLVLNRINHYKLCIVLFILLYFYFCLGNMSTNYAYQTSRSL